jgi:hypothetical protein
MQAAVAIFRLISPAIVGGGLYASPDNRVKVMDPVIRRELSARLLCVSEPKEREKPPPSRTWWHIPRFSVAACGEVQARLSAV